MSSLDLRSMYLALKHMWIIQSLKVCKYTKGELLHVVNWSSYIHFGNLNSNTILSNCWYHDVKSLKYKYLVVDILEWKLQSIKLQTSKLQSQDAIYSLDDLYVVIIH